MSSNLKVNSLVPATGTEIGIGTTGGTIDFRCAATFGGNVTIGGTLTYDEVINIDSIGIVTARTGIIDSTLTAGRVVYADTDKSLTDNAKLTFDGSQLFVTRNLSTAANDSVTGSEFRAGMFYFRSRGDSAGISGTTYANQLISSNGSNVPLEIYTQGSATNTPIVFGVNVVEKFRIHSTGVNVKGDIDLDNGGSAGVNFKRNGTLKSDIEIGSASDQLAIRARGSSGFISLHTNTSTAERLRILPNGQIGIGITNPISKIGVEGTGNGSTGSVNLGDTAAAASLFLKTHSGSSTGLALGGRNTGGQYIQGEYQNSTVVSVRDLSINPYGGGVGIGTLAPNFGANPGADTIVFGTSQTERLRIDSDGDLWHGLTPVTHHGNRHAFFHNSGDNYVSITSGTSNTAGIVFGDSAANTTANYESYIAHWNNNNSLYLYTGQGTKGLELKSGGDASIIDGNLLLASGHGVNFQASGTGSGTTVNSHVLDDYERGTFTPKIYYGTGTNEPSYSWRYGHYIKVGKQVTVWFNIGITGFSPSNTEQVHIANLPFQHNDPNSQWKYLNLMFGYSWASGWGFNSGSNNQMFIAIYDNESKARVVKHDGAHIYTNDVGSGQRFSSYFSYQTDS